MFYDDNELDNAVKTLDEGQGVAIEDSHEEEEKYPFDENDINNQNASSYKQESRLYTKSFNQKVKELKAANLSEEEYAKQYQTIKDAYDKAIASLKEKYHEELAYHIHPRLKRRKELIGDQTKSGF